MDNSIKRVGLIELQIGLFIDRNNGTFDSNYFKLLFSNFFPFRISEDYIYNNGIFYFYCYSNYFREVEFDEVVPAYEITFKRDIVGDKEEISIEKVEEVKHDESIYVSWYNYLDSKSKERFLRKIHELKDI